jgi:hypothetical protein
MGIGPNAAQQLRSTSTMQLNPRAVADFAGYADPCPKTPPAPPVPLPHVDDPLCPKVT